MQSLIWSRACAGAGAGRAAPLDGLEVEDHVREVQADHAEDAAARAGDRQAVVLERRAEEVACARAAPGGTLVSPVARAWAAGGVLLAGACAPHCGRLAQVMAGAATRHPRC